MTTHLYIEYNPYTLKTEIKVNGNLPKETSFFSRKDGERIQEWIEGLPEKAYGELNENEINIEFKGIKMDYEDLKYVCDNYQKAKFNIKHIPGEEIEKKEKLVRDIFEAISNGPVEELRGEKTNRIFENVLENILEVNVLATMSSGKSTVINAILDEEILPSENKACTAVIFKIIDNDKDKFKVVIRDAEGNEVQTYNETENTGPILDILKELNDPEYIKENNVAIVELYGNIPFVRSDEEKLVLVDTPGPNNANNEHHGMVTQKMIASSNKDLILYIMDGTTLTSNDSNEFLSMISESMKEGGLQSRDRFIFVLNKMDNLKKGESLEGIIDEARKLLKRHNIENPIIIPLSGLAALKLRKYLEMENNKENQTMEYMMGKGVFDELSLIRNFNDRIHLEEYVNLPGESREKINRELEEAKSRGNMVDQAIIHTGIRPLEEAISVYLNKYFKTAKIKNTSEAIERHIKSVEIENKLKNSIMATEDSKKLAKESIGKIQKEMESGKKAKKLEKKINTINLEKKFNDLIKDINLEYTNWVTKYTEDNSGKDKEIKKEESAKEISMIQGIIDKKLRSFLIKVEEQTENILIKESEKIIEEYKSYLREISKDLSFEGVEFDMEGVLASNVSSIKNKTISKIVNKNTYEKEVIVGKKRVRNYDKKFYKPWTWFEPSYYNKKIRENQEFIKMDRLIKDMLTSIEQEFRENLEEGKKEGLKKQEDLKRSYKTSLRDLDEELSKKLENYNRFIKELKNRESELESLKEMDCFVKNINSMIEELKKI